MPRSLATSAPGRPSFDNGAPFSVRHAVAAGLDPFSHSVAMKHVDIVSADLNHVAGTRIDVIAASEAAFFPAAFPDDPFASFPPLPFPPSFPSPFPLPPPLPFPSLANALCKESSARQPFTVTRKGIATKARRIDTVNSAEAIFYEKAWTLLLLSRDAATEIYAVVFRRPVISTSDDG